MFKTNAKCIATAAAALVATISSAAQAQGWMYQSGPGGTPPAMYNTPYAPQNQRWGDPSYNPNTWTQAPAYSNQPLGEQRLSCVAMRGVSADPRCR